MENIKIKKKYLVLTVLILLSVVVTTSFAYFGAQIVGGSVGTSSIVSGELSLELSDSSVNATNLEPIYEQYYQLQAYKKEFSVTNSNTGLNSCTQIYLDLNVFPIELKNEYFKWKIVTSDNREAEGNFINASIEEDFLLLDNSYFTQGQSKTFTLYIYVAYDEAEEQISILNQSLQGVIKVKGSDVKEAGLCSEGWYAECQSGNTDIKCKILLDNLTQSNVKSDANIDFTFSSEGKKSPEVNDYNVIYDANQVTNGLYYTSDTTKTENSQRVYYFRGAVENNYLIYGGFCFRIVRTVEDGSVRLRYGGIPTSGVCPQTGTDVSLASIIFNATFDDNTYQGFMMGLDNQCGTSTSCRGSITTTSKAQAQTNTYNSSMKLVLEAWYTGGTTSKKECSSLSRSCNFTSLGTSALVNNSSLIADTPYCNDRSIVSQIYNLGYGTNRTYYAAGHRLESRDLDNNTDFLTAPVVPTYKCTQQNDAFTVSSQKGNGDLTYPIGLLTADEIVYAGVVFTSGSNHTNYLYTNGTYWTLTPAYTSNTTEHYIVESDGRLSNFNDLGDFGLIPAISLVPEATISSGIGTYNNPYIVNN